MARILIVEDEPDLAGLLLFNLRAEGYEVETASTGAAAVAQAQNLKPDLVLLDLMLPDISGSEVARIIKSSPELRKTAVVMLTAKGSEEERVLGLQLGADDYVVKPFSVRELTLRVKAVLRRTVEEEPSDAALMAGGIALDPERHEVRVQGSLLSLTALEFRLLQTLLLRPHRVQTREVLLSDVWGIEADVTTRTVDTHIKRLREKLGPAGEQIETVRGVGYKLVPASVGPP